MNMTLRKFGRATVVAALVVGGLQVVTSSPAAAVAGLIRVPGGVTADNATVDKNIFAQCPLASPRIVGGGIVINDHGRRQVFARLMQPIKNLSGGSDIFVVAATAPSGFVGTYSLQAIAVCATNAGVPGHEVITGPATAPSSSSAQDTIVPCSSSTKRVIGFGGGVFSGGRAVGLQTIRSTGPRDASRAFAHEVAGGFDTTWSMRAYAICMTSSNNTPPSGAPVPGQVASTLCSNSPNSFVHGPGGGAWDGIGLINQIVPSANLKLNTVTITSGSTAAFTSTICIP